MPRFTRYSRFVPLFETDKMDERVINGKVGLSTFHSVKGRQRKYVFILGFDNGYFDFYARNLPHHTCPNTLYGRYAPVPIYFYLKVIILVLTVLLNSYNMIITNLLKVISVNFGTPRSIFYEKSDQEKREIAVQNTTPSELIKFMHEDVLDIITPILSRIFIVTTPKQETFEIPAIVQTGAKLYEEVSDLNGIAILCMYYDEIQRKWNDETRSTLFDMILERFVMIETSRIFKRSS